MIQPLRKYGLGLTNRSNGTSRGDRVYIYCYYSDRIL